MIRPYYHRIARCAFWAFLVVACIPLAGQEVVSDSWDVRFGLQSQLVVADKVVGWLGIEAYAEVLTDPYSSARFGVFCSFRGDPEFMFLGSLAWHGMGTWIRPVISYGIAIAMPHSGGSYLASVGALSLYFEVASGIRPFIQTRMFWDFVRSLWWDGSVGIEFAF